MASYRVNPVPMVGGAKKSTGKTWEVIDMRQKEGATMEGLGYTQPGGSKFNGSEVKTHLDLGGGLGKRGLKTTQSLAPSGKYPSDTEAIIDEAFMPRRSVSPAGLSTPTSPVSFSAPRRPSPISREPPPPAYDHPVSPPAHSPMGVPYRVSTTTSRVHDKLYRQALKRQDNQGRWRGVASSIHDREFHDTLRTAPLSALKRPKSIYKVGWGAGGLKTDAWEWRNPHKRTAPDTTFRRTKSQAITSDEKNAIWNRLHTHSALLKKQKADLLATTVRHDRAKRDKKPIDRCYSLVGSTFGTKASKVETQRVLASAEPAIKEVQPRVYNQVATWNRLHTNTTKHTKSQSLKITEQKPPPKFVKPTRKPRRFSRQQTVSDNGYPRASEGGTASPPHSVNTRPSYHLPLSTHNPIATRADKPGWTRETDPVVLLQPQMPHAGQVEAKLLDETTIRESARRHYNAEHDDDDEEEEVSEDPIVAHEPLPVTKPDPLPVSTLSGKGRAPAPRFPAYVESDSEEDLAF